MSGLIVVGVQWGDEGKGKIIDLLSAQADWIVRAQGGNNAGHTVVIGQEEYKLNLIPSGIFNPQAFCAIAAGTVIDPAVLLAEIEQLEKRNIQVKDRLWISPGAHLILPYHKQIDSLQEKKKGKLAVGTTGRGIGPCYADKANRIGIQVGQWIDSELFSALLNHILPLKNEEIVKLYGGDPIDYASLLKDYSQMAKKLNPFVKPFELDLHKALEGRENVLFEGAQGAFLDNTHGTYPFVTSSSTLSAGICMGAGVGPVSIGHVLGVVKAYTTRVGNGPFPTELKEHELFLNHHEAREFGTTTGRRRRVGWFDAVMARTGVRLNGIQSLALTKLDILDSVDELKICTGYTLGSKTVKFMPALTSELEKVVPFYESMPGWKSSTRGIRDPGELPREARAYLKRIEQLCGVPISILSMGPGREDTLIIKDLFPEREGLEDE